MVDPSQRDPAHSAEPGTLRGGRYQLLGALGSGSQAETFEAEDRASGLRVAIKRFSVRGAKSWKDVELAEREARVLAQLSHPSLPRYIEHFEQNGALYLVMEKIEGRSLGDLRRAGGVLSRAEVLAMIAELGATLRYLHGRAPPLIHRDIKPNNVILRPDGSFALVDFGSVRERLRPEGGSTVVGTFGYMAPEQFQGRALPATDVYGVGATALACLTGQEPENLPHQGLGIDVARALGGQVEPALVRLLAELLDPNPDQRASDLPRALERHFGRSSGFGSAPEAAREPRPEPPRHDRAPAGWRQPPSPRQPFHRVVPFGGLILLVILVALSVARFATWGLFRLFLPILLGLLAVFFGGQLRRTAHRMSEIGRAGDEGLRRASDYLRGARQRRGSRAERRAARFRVRDDPEPWRAERRTEDAEDYDEFEDEWQRGRPRRHR